MHALNCDQIQQEIYAYLDGELSENQQKEIDGHLESCAACSEFYAESLEFEKDLKLFTEMPDQEPPSNGWAKFKDRLNEYEELEIELPEYSVFQKIQLTLKRNMSTVGLVAAACLLVLIMDQKSTTLEVDFKEPAQHSPVQISKVQETPPTELMSSDTQSPEKIEQPIIVFDTQSPIINPVSASFNPASALSPPTNDASQPVGDVLASLDFPVPLVIEDKDLGSMVSIGSGKWISPAGQRVDLDSFMMDRFPVTNREYLVFVKQTGQRSPFHWNGLSFEDVDDTGLKPVTYVSWEDADTYCKWKGMSLPSNAQWEWAAGGQDNKRFPWGNEFATRLANTKESSKGIVNIGSYPENLSAFGVYDMVGNIREWVTDSPRETKGAIPGIVRNLRLMKGGSYLDPAEKSTIRDSFEGLKDEIYGNAGIRCVALAK